MMQQRLAEGAADMPAGRRTFLADRLRLVFGDSWATLSIHVINAAVVAFVYRDVVPAHVPVIWFFFIVLAVGLRLALCLWYRRAAPSAEAATVWAWRLIPLTALGGIGWGVGGVAMMSMAPPIYQILVTFVLAGMAAGGLPSLSRVFPAYLAFLVPVLLPAILYFGLQGTELALSISGMGVLLLAFLVMMGRRQETVIVGNLRTASENRELVEDLREEISKREQAQSRLRNREDTLARAQRIANLGTWEWDVAKDTITSSEVNNRLFGRDLNAPEYSFDAVMELIHPDDRERVSTAVNMALVEGGSYSCDYRVLLPGGAERVIFEQADVASDEDGKPVLVTGINLDITDRYHAQERLRLAMREAEDASEAKSQFLANMSHELRTPLNAVIGYSEILKEDALERGNTDIVPDLDRINVAGRHLLELINEVLDLSRIEAGRTEIFVEVVDLPQFMNEVAETVRPLAAANGNRFTLEIPADIGAISTDATKLRQILYNLLSNAAKFTENGEIRFMASRITDDAGAGGAEWIRFRVSDTGIGIAPGDMEQVFAAFERSDAGRASRYGGTGLGLAICRYYCEMMGGAISVDSRLGEGSDFTVRLPTVVETCRPARVATAE